MRDVLSTDYLFWRGEDARRDKDQFSSPQGWAGHGIADQGLSSPSPHQDAREKVLQTAALLDPGQCS